ncbi:hypothetical protein B9Z55_027752 [Caenorhabditis nigoni]|uniref:7TM GPCR serpentine receptor class x (Srx) domain-containing protein n=1 Tax=Caenorhabditis nigoni TaxID=1611254 RepID=A0A2G5SE58_9PELO|nr:hypothetical protein B9Z55_027752 [Caenorhabditis nigoni]
MFMQRSSYTENVLMELGYSRYEIEHNGFIGFIFYPKVSNGTQTIINWDSFIGVSVTTTTLGISEIIMAYYGFKCYIATKKLVSLANNSKKFETLQWQLFYALFAQTMIPLIFMQIPMTVNYVFTMILGTSFPLLGRWVVFAVSGYLATDAWPTILIIKPYRDTLISLMCFWKLWKVKVSPNQAIETNSNMLHSIC